MRPRHFYVYILASKIGGTLYIGVTSDLIRRVAEHRLKLVESFTEKYDVEHYTKEGLERIDRANLKDILLTEFPELRHSNLVTAPNAFGPWDAKVAPKSTDLEKS